MNADSVLGLARDYVSKHSPGLLDTEGGSVNLKVNWALKALTRAHETLRMRLV